MAHPAPEGSGIVFNAADVFREVWIKGGAFAGGFFLGALLSLGICYATFKLVSRERIEREKIDLEREKELRKQLEIKEDRILALHKLLDEHTKKKRV